MTKMTVNTKKIEEYSLKDVDPYNQLQYMEGQQRIVSVKFSVKPMPKKHFTLKLSKRERFLYRQ